MCTLPTKISPPQRIRFVPAMSALRETGDQLELMVPHESWPLATYREMLFIK